METVTHGVFKMGSISDKHSTQIVYCKPVGITLYTAPKPTGTRTVAYGIELFATMPRTVQDLASGKRYIRDQHETFTFRYLSKETDVEDLLNQIRRHFCEVVLRGKEFRWLSNALEVIDVNDGSVVIGNIGTSIVEISKVTHEEIVDTDDTGRFIVVAGALRAKYRIYEPGDNKEEIALKDANYFTDYIEHQRMLVEARKMVIDHLK